ncbi:MAG: hypothetical protein WCQ49_01480 [Candidatus Saccharibacteria bacterium]
MDYNENKNLTNEGVIKEDEVYPTYELTEDTYAEEMKNNMAKTEEALQQIINDSPDKEAFDYAKFANLYWKQDLVNDLDGNEPEKIKKSFLKRYYLQHPEVKTIEEFVKTLEYLDSVSSN